jgi:hypothetical protein
VPPVAARDRVADELARTYATAYQRLKREEDSLLNEPLAWRRRARLRELETEVLGLIGRLDTKARTWVEDRLPTVWAAGATSLARKLPDPAGFTWTTPHVEGLQQAAATTYDYLLNATRYLSQSTKALVRSIVHEETLQKLVSGATATQEGRIIMERLVAANGLSRVPYANGAMHPLNAYTQMVARSQSALAYNYGSIVQAADEGVAMMEVLDGPSCGWSTHASGEIANGKIVTLAEAAEFPFSHPNCVRAFAPRPDLKPRRNRRESAADVAEASAAGQRAVSPAGRTFAKQVSLSPRERMLAKRSERVAGKVPRRAPAPRAPEPPPEPKWRDVKNAKQAEAQLAERFGEIDGTGKWKAGVSRRFGLDGMSGTVANKVGKAVADLIEAHPKTAADIRGIGSSTSMNRHLGPLAKRMGPNHIGDASGGLGTIRLNSSWFKGDGSKLANQLAKDVAPDADGVTWHPRGTGDITSIVNHEFGHFIDFRATQNGGGAYTAKIQKILRDPAMGKRDLKDVMNAAPEPNVDLGVELSRYAKTNYKELMAEATAEVLTSANPRPLAKALYELALDYSERWTG